MNPTLCEYTRLHSKEYLSKSQSIEDQSRIALHLAECNLCNTFLFEVNQLLNIEIPNLSEKQVSQQFEQLLPHITQQPKNFFNFLFHWFSQPQYAYGFAFGILLLFAVEKFFSIDEQKQVYQVTNTAIDNDQFSHDKNNRLLSLSLRKDTLCYISSVSDYAIIQNDDEATLIQLNAGEMWMHYQNPAHHRKILFQTPFEEIRIVGTTLHIVVNENAVSIDVLEGTVESYRYDTDEKTVITQEQSYISINHEQLNTIELSLKQKFYSLFPELLSKTEKQDHLIYQVPQKVSLAITSKENINKPASDRVNSEEKKQKETSDNEAELEEWYKAAELLMEQGNYQESISTFLDIIKKNPHTVYAQNAYMEIARIYEKNLFDLSLSMSILNEYLQQYPQGIFVAKSKKILCENKHYQYCKE